MKLSSSKKTLALVGALCGVIAAGDLNAYVALVGFILGMFVGAALCHNFGLASSGTAKNAETGELVLGAASQNGKIAVTICIVLLVAISIAGIKRKKA